MEKKVKFIGFLVIGLIAAVVLVQILGSSDLDLVKLIGRAAPFLR